MNVRSSLATCLALLWLAAAAHGADEGGFVITAERVEGSEGPAGRVAHLEGEVTLTRGGAVLVGERGVFYETRGLAVISGHVHGVDGTSRVSCDTLRYYRDLDRALLIGNATYSDTTGTTSADRIDVYRRESIAVASGNAVAAAEDGRSRLEARKIVYDFDRREADASGAPVLTTFDEEGAVDATLAAEVIELRRDRGRIAAFGDVRIETADVRTSSRVAVLTREEGSVLLTGEPRLDRGGDVLTGDRVLVFAREGEVSRVISTGHAAADYHIEPQRDEEPQWGRVGGDTLTMYFEKGEPILTTARGQAESRHFVGETGERNVVHSGALDVLFSEGRIERAVFRGEAEGIYAFVPTGRETGIGLEPARPDTAGAPADTGAVALTPAALDSVMYRAPEIDYYVERNRIVLTGGARVDYKDTVLTAAAVVFDPDEQVLSATGEPDLVEKGDHLVGSALSYDLDAHTGAVRGGITTFEQGLYSGDILREADGTLLVRNGVYTTCAEPRPHYRLVSHRMKVYLDDKVVAKPVILYLGEIPVFALPFYVFPIRKERHSGFLIPQIELGFSEDKGRFVRNFGYYWAPSDYFDVTAWADFYEQTKWIGHLETRYKKRYTLSGSVNTSFMQELLNNRRRWDLQVSHLQEIGRNWTAGGSGDFRSDATYASDAFQTIQESVNRSLHSQLWLRGRWSSVSLGVTLDRREELDQGTISELLPKVDVTASQSPLVTADEESGRLARWLSKVSMSWDAHAVNDRDRSGATAVSRQAAGVGVSLRTSGRFMGWLSLSPRFSARGNVYDRDREGREFPTRLTYDAGVSAGTSVYGTFFPELGPVRALRHIVEPSVSFSWTPDFARYFDQSGTDLFFAPSGFGSTPRKREAISLSLVNKLQAKVGSGEDVRKIDNLARLSMSTSYDFEAEGYRWADLSSELEVRPDQAVSLRWNARHDTRDFDLESMGVTASLGLRGSAPAEIEEPWEERVGLAGGSPVDELRREIEEQGAAGRKGLQPWDASLTFRYSRGADASNSTYWGDASVAISLSPKWRLDYSIHYDLKANEVASQEYTIWRDLHCWEAQFTRRYYDGDWEYYFRISVKVLPEIQLEGGRKYLERSVQ
jgi:lipopolysaccharide assembly outer membrane protein LptD (OstA)